MNQRLQDWATWTEIHNQPQIWRDWGKSLDVAGLRAWIATLDVEEIWFCGAGTSAYIGDILSAQIKGTKSVPTTDLVARPAHYLTGARPLVVSFGRSGNSAETIGTLDALDVLAPNAPRLNITCNSNGALAQRTATTGRDRLVLLPEATHDAGFAMTSSFSTMLISALALFDAPCDLASRCKTLADQLQGILDTYSPPAPPKRTVFVGTGPLAFAAREAALKVMELSAGSIPALWDSTLGFRHGPKSFVTEETLITVFVSPDQPAAQYDGDLVAELRLQFPKSRVVTIGPSGDVDIAMPFGPAWASPLCIATAQICGVVWAHGMGRNVDDPFAGLGTLSRVVSGVQLYPVTP